MFALLLAAEAVAAAGATEETVAVGQADYFLRAPADGRFGEDWV